MLYAQCVGLAEDVAYPRKPPPLSSQATRSHPGKPKSSLLCSQFILEQIFSPLKWILPQYCKTDNHFKRNLATNV